MALYDLMIQAIQKQGVCKDELDRVQGMLTALVASKELPIRDRLYAEKARRALQLLLVPPNDDVDYRCALCLKDVRYCPPDYPCGHGYDMGFADVVRFAAQKET